jgi:hypothetical protein
MLTIDYSTHLFSKLVLFYKLLENILVKHKTELNSSKAQYNDSTLVNRLFTA